MRKGIAVALGTMVLASAATMAAKPVRPPEPPVVSGVKVFSAGQNVGYVLSLYRGDYGDYLTIITATGYLADFLLSTGGFSTYTSRPSSLVYTGTNCSGDMYAAMPDGNGLWKLHQGMVFEFGPNVYYTMRGATLPFGIDYWSSRSVDGSCYTSSTRRNVQNAVPAFPNDVAITGIPSEGLSQPVVFGIP